MVVNEETAPVWTFGGEAASLGTKQKITTDFHMVWVQLCCNSTQMTPGTALTHTLPSKSLNVMKKEHKQVHVVCLYSPRDSDKEKQT